VINVDAPRDIDTKARDAGKGAHSSCPRRVVGVVSNMHVHPCVPYNMSALLMPAAIHLQAVLLCGLSSAVSAARRWAAQPASVRDAALLQFAQLLEKDQQGLAQVQHSIQLSVWKHY
jgi:acyl-CoA reductase-like NAD-dependent aldehyde dehydrogenase